MRNETLGEACVRLQQEYRNAGPGEREYIDGLRRAHFALAIRRGVSYRQLAQRVGLSLSNLHYTLRNNDTERPLALERPV